MSKMSEMAAAVEDMRRCAAVINDTADWLSSQFYSSDPVAAEPDPVEPELTLEAVRAVLADKSRAGFTTQIRSLLQKHGADRLSEVDPVHYKALLADAEGLKDAT